MNIQTFVRFGKGLIAFAVLLGFDALAAQPQPQPFAIAGELIVKFNENATDAEIAHGLQLGQLKVKDHVLTSEMGRHHHPGLSLVVTPLGLEVALERLKNHPAIDYVEPNYTYTHQLTANDPSVANGQLWGMAGDLSTPANQYGSQAAEAWTQGYVGSQNIYVGVIDEGIQTTHPDLLENIWNNPFDPVDGHDNDGNGYIDDTNGWDFFNRQNQVYNPDDGDSHGTHVAGTIGAKGGNAIGVAGVNWNVKMIAAKFMGGGSGSTLGAVQAIDYLVDLKKRHNLNIVAINASWGGAGYSQSLHDAIIRAAKANILFVAAAGNESLNNDSSSSYPANIDTRIGTSTSTAATYNAVISVAAIDRYGALATFSNYGANRVHLGAPGVNILSTVPNNTYASYNGTSMATPHVTGAAALYASTHPTATADQIRQALLNSGLATPSLSGFTSTGRRLNLSSIVAAVPAAPTGVTATAGDKTVTLKWNSSANAQTYRVLRSLTSGSGYNTIAANLTSLTYTDKTVSNGTTYYYVITAVNSSGISPRSVPVGATPMPAGQIPAAPSTVTASAAQAIVAGTSVITVSWTGSASATSYTLKRASSSTGPWTVVASNLTSLTCRDTVLANGSSYHYVVTARNASGESPDSMVKSITPVRPQPSTLTATAVSSTQLTLKWIDKSADEQGFKIDYYNGTSWVQVGTTAPNATSASITGTTSRTTYSFRVRAYNGTLNTPYSNTATITMP